MVRLQQNLLLLAANLLVPLTAVLFIVGFFRGKPGASTPAGIDVDGKERVVSKSAPFNKVIFMMVDALRRSEIILHPTNHNPFR
jgi:ethanolaminephosphotransferase